MGFRLLDMLFGPHHESFVGDLSESYRERRDHEGRLAAVFWLTWQLVVGIPRLAVFTLTWGTFMFRNYLVIAFRQMRRFWSFSLVNVLGLALSMAVCMLILSLLHDQGKVDAFHERADHIVRVTSRVRSSTGTYRMATSASALGPELARLSPDVEQLLQMRRSGGQLTRENGMRASFRGLYAQPTFFDFFDFELMEGDSRSALDEPFEVVLSQEFARMLFGDANPVGEVLLWENVGDVIVSGVLAPYPGKTHARSDILLSFASMESLAAAGHDIQFDDWTHNSQFYNYFLLRDGARVADLEKLAEELARQHHRDPESLPPEYRVQALTDINLGADLSNQIASVLSSQVAIVLSILAAILVLTAVFNYVNLTVSRSVRRAREIGIRKVMGAHRRQLAYQLVTEAVVTSLIALLAAAPLLAWMLPRFNSLSAVSDPSGVMQVNGVDSGLALQFVVFAVLLGVVAGLIPAWKMSSLAPTSTLKGLRVGGGRGHALRKTMVVGQFAISMIAIVFTVVIFRQAAFMSAADLGFDESELLHIDMQGLKYDVVRSELMRIPGVSMVAATSAAPSGGSNTWTDIRTEDMEEPIMMQTFSIDEGFLDQYRIRVLAGRNLVPGTADETEAILISEAAAEKLRLGSPDEAIGTQLIYDTYSFDRPVTVAGVVSNFYSNGVEDGLAPVTLKMRPDDYRFAAVRLDGAVTSEVLGRIQEVWDRLAPGTPMRYQFFADQVRETFAGMTDALRILGLFAFLIVTIASLGLLGMASYSAETRVREVGIRKVVGAEVRTLVALLSREYLVLIGLATLIAVPVAFLLTSKYLALFAEHVAIGPVTILAGLAPVIILALVTVGSQTLRAALANPAEVLRAE